MNCENERQNSRHVTESCTGVTMNKFHKAGITGPSRINNAHMRENNALARENNA